MSNKAHLIALYQAALAQGFAITKIKRGASLGLTAKDFRELATLTRGERKAYLDGLTREVLA